MSRFVEPAPRGARRAAVLAVMLAALAVPAAMAGLSGKEASAPGAAVSGKAAKPTAVATTRAYQLRCWQYGRLIFEELTGDSPAESRQDVMRLHDRSGGPVLLFETANSTCLLKAAELPAPAKTPGR